MLALSHLTVINRLKSKTIRMLSAWTWPNHRDFLTPSQSQKTFMYPLLPDAPIDFPPHNNNNNKNYNIIVFGSHRRLRLWLLCVLDFLIHIHIFSAACNCSMLVLKSLLPLSHSFHSTLFPVFIYELSINPNRKYNVVINNIVCLPPSHWTSVSSFKMVFHRFSASQANLCCTSKVKE